MRNISFDNPYLLLLIIPFVLLIVVPFVLAFRKGYKGKAVITSLILHLVMAALVTVAVAGTTVTTVITQTQVYVVADLSYSAHRNVDEIDGYVQGVQKNLPTNAQMGVVCFGRDYQVLVELGEELVSVSQSSIDDSATNIAQTLNFVANLFDENAIKRVVLITDGKQTDEEGAGQLIAAIENLYAQNVYIDAVYVDSNLPETQTEAQISQVEYTPSTYTGIDSSVSVLVQSNYQAQAILSLYQGADRVKNLAIELTKGYNVFHFDLPTNSAGEFEYTVHLSADGDFSENNNSYQFTQSVTQKLNVLLVASSQADQTRIQEMYGDGAEIDGYINANKIPYTIETLSKYDEIVLSNVDVRKLENVTAFMEALDQAVSLYGKSLITFGDTMIQNKADDELKKLEDMLPVRFGNSDQDPKLYGLVIDTSRSMQNASRFLMMKEAAIQLLGLLGKNDYVTVVSFSGDIEVLQSPVPAVANRQKIEKKIRDIQPTQGTFLGKGLQTAVDLMKDLNYSQKQIMLISDGESYTLEEDDPVQTATNAFSAYNIVTSTINPHNEPGASALQSIATAGNGRYYEIVDENSIEELMFSEIADEVTETVVLGEASVQFKRASDGVLQGLSSLPSVSGYVYAKAKASATTVLTTVYERETLDDIDAPIYAYWNYGNGKVSTFTSALTGDWTAAWSGEEGTNFFKNVFRTNTPKERISHPYTVETQFTGAHVRVEITPADLKSYATATAVIPMPDGTQQEQALTFDSEKYFYKFETPMTGRYEIKVQYAYDDERYESVTYFTLSYSPEYNAFTVFSESTLYTSIRNRGTVSIGEVPTLENDEKQATTYRLSLALPLLILTCVLYIIDLIIRKLKWEDVRSFFKKKGVR